MTDAPAWLACRSGAPYVIAEIGINHDGDLERARRSIDAAADAGADAVKFQSFRAAEFMADKELVYTWRAGGREHSESMYEMFARLELPADWHGELAAHARARGVDFSSSAADAESADLLAALGVPWIKLASEDLINLPLVEHVAALGVPVLASTGMADSDEVDRAVERLRAARADFALLHCVSSYPTPDEQANLRRMASLAERHGVPVGYSDHTLGCAAAAAASALGAVAIEKHFTLDRGLAGPDHALSSDPAELAALVDACRRAARLLGDGAIAPAPCEAKGRVEFRRSVVATRALASGTRLERDMLALKRPARGLPPHRLEGLVGRRLARALAADEPVGEGDLT